MPFELLASSNFPAIGYGEGVLLLGVGTILFLLPAIIERKDRSPPRRYKLGSGTLAAMSFMTAMLAAACFGLETPPVPGEKAKLMAAFLLCGANAVTSIWCMATTKTGRDL